MKFSEENIRERLKNRAFRELKEILDRENEMDIAEILDALNSEETIMAFRLLSKDKAAEVFACLSPDHQRDIINSITDKELGRMVDDLFIDDAVDMVEELPAGVVRRVLENSSDETRRLINQFLNFPENSAGSIMTAEYIGLKKHMTVQECFRYIKKHAIRSETIYTCFVTDEYRRIEGVVSVKDLFLHPKPQRIEEFMDTHVIVAHTHDDREAVADMFNKYDILSLPVVDNENRLVGIVTVDDAFDVMEQEATEDFQKMAAMAPSERPYLKTNAFILAKNRILWLAVLMLSDTIAGTILAGYENAFRALPLLVSFIPMLMGTGGNAGSQSSTMIIRGMAVGEIHLGDYMRVLFKELQVGFISGLILGIINFIRLIIFYPGQPLVILTVVLSIHIIVICAKIIGAVLPMIAKAVKLDPAIMAAPLITTIVDALGLIVYFQLATHLIGL
ncbi:MAG: magnesium transporter [Eubacteriales bacterium]|nr:magnesium transporter [Eubacteriales bacterium]